MLVKMTSKRQVTFSKAVVEKFHLKAGDSLAVHETEEGNLIRPHRFDVARLAPLREKISRDLPAPDYKTVRHAALDPRLRD
jgi:bifunctional DNA-binding transcriptional regulator/antitoxin component of YhaV-PrlF toxin-antitoxin module